MKWIPVEKRLPKIGQLVLCFYMIEEHKYYVTGQIRSISIIYSDEAPKVSKVVEWTEGIGWDPISPLGWTPIIEPKGY